MEKEGVSLGSCTLVRHSRAAMLVDSPDYGQVWVPYSQIHDDSTLYEKCEEGDEGEVVVSTWLAGERGWT